MNVLTCWELQVNSERTLQNTNICGQKKNQQKQSPGSFSEIHMGKLLNSWETFWHWLLTKVKANAITITVGINQIFQHINLKWSHISWNYDLKNCLHSWDGNGISCSWKYFTPKVVSWDKEKTWREVKLKFMSLLCILSWGSKIVYMNSLIYHILLIFTGSNLLINTVRKSIPPNVMSHQQGAVIPFRRQQHPHFIAGESL